MRRDGLTFTIVGAVAMLGLGALLLLLYVVTPLMSGSLGELGEDQLVSSVAQYSVLGICITLVSVLLLSSAISALRGSTPRIFQPSPLWGIVAVIVFLLALAGGVAVQSWPVVTASYLFPWMALLAVLTPPLLALSLLRGRNIALWKAAPVGPGGLLGRTTREDPYAGELTRQVAGPPSWRRILGSLAWGIGGATSIALVLQIFALIIGAVLAFAVVAITNPSFNLDSLNNLSGTNNCGATQELLFNPLVGFGVILAVSVIVPLIEEPAKSLAVFILRRSLTAPLDAFLYGAAAGIGFGMFESSVYNVGDLGFWWGTASLRSGTTLIHALATGLFGLAWYQLQHGGGRRGFLRFAAASVAVHGAWNAITVVISGIAIARNCAGDAFTLIQRGDPLGYALIGVMAIAAMVAGVLLFLIARRLAAGDTLAAQP